MCRQHQFFVYYDDLRDHLRNVHKIRDVPREMLRMYESFPGSLKYMLYKNPRLRGVHHNSPPQRLRSNQEVGSYLSRPQIAHGEHMSTNSIDVHHSSNAYGGTKQNLAKTMTDQQLDITLNNRLLPILKELPALISKAISDGE